jgi:hypothetical protein
LHGGCLAGTVGSEEAEDLTTINIEGDMVDGSKGTELLGQVMDGYYG